MNEGAFELPHGEVHDRTVHILEIKHPEHDDLGLVVCRAPVPVGKSLRELARGRILEERARLSGYSVVEERDAEWAELPAVEFTSRWRYRGKVYHQQQAHLAVNGAWMYFAMSAPIGSREACDAWFSQLHATLRLRSGE